jgi:unspecific monooxygenase
MSLPAGPAHPSWLQMIHFSVRPLAYLDECAQRYGDPFTLRLPGFGNFVMISAPELVKQVFTEDAEILHAGKANAMLEPILGPNSVLLLDGKPHLRQRRLLLPPLHGERMQAYAQLMAEITATEIDRMPRGEPFSLHTHMQSITLQVILRAVFGLDHGARMDALARLLTEYLTPPHAIFTFLPIEYADFPFSPYRTFLRRREAVDRELRSILRERMKEHDPSRTDILSLLLSARDEDGQPMTEDELRDELLTMLLAGHETTATALAWTFGCILQNADVASRIDDELERARGTKA